MYAIESFDFNDTFEKCKNIGWESYVTKVESIKAANSRPTRALTFGDITKRLKRNNVVIVYSASRHFRSVTKEVIIGTGVHYFNNGSKDAFLNKKVVYSGGLVDTLHLFVGDRNLRAGIVNGYNDWFLFANLYDAEQWSNKEHVVC
jgi:hypothetical protein